jgi:hypothetical protein
MPAHPFWEVIRRKMQQLRNPSRSKAIKLRLMLIAPPRPDQPCIGQLRGLVTTKNPANSRGTALIMWTYSRHFMPVMHHSICGRVSHPSPVTLTICWKQQQRPPTSPRPNQHRNIQLQGRLPTCSTPPSRMGGGSRGPGTGLDFVAMFGEIASQRQGRWALFCSLVPQSTRQARSSESGFRRATQWLQ